MTGARTKILLVCTANQCRSPLAAAFARRDAAGLAVDFESAGLLRGGVAMPAVGVKVAGEFGFDLADHLSRQLDPRSLPRYDVVLTMTRAQARELVADSPALWPRVFTLGQFSKWLGAHPLPAARPLRDWILDEGQSRSMTELVGQNPDDDIRDPLTSPARVWRSVAREIEHQLGQILSSLYPAG